jgi:hypothetical protein
VIALVAALLLQDAYAGIGQVVRLEAPWDHVEIGGWTFSADAADSSLIMLTRPAMQRGKLWVRFEYRDDAEGALRSSRILVELDCAQGRTRILQGAAYVQSNLRGRPTDIGAGNWSYAAPDTLAEFQLEDGCGD